MTIRLSTAGRDGSANGVVDLLDAGSGPGVIEVYTGAQPATANTAPSGTLLATVTLAKPAFGNSATGTASGVDPAAVSIVASGTAGWFRAKDSAGNAVFDGSVSASGGGGDLIVSPSTNFVSGGSFDVTALSITAPAG